MNKDSLRSIDPLGEALHLLRMSGIFYCRSELSAPWAMALPSGPSFLSFHALTSGQCWLEVEGESPRLLQEGDMALLPHGEGHSLTSELGLRAPRIADLPHDKISDRYAVLRHGGGGDPTILVCGAIRFDHPSAHHLVRQLPRIIHVEASKIPHLDWFQSTLKFLASEAMELRPGGETVITRLADILVIQAIRSWIKGDSTAKPGWLSALKDRQIGRAIAVIHRDPSRLWTVASLAEESAMSRSAFAARFTELVGEPVMHYVTRWRMNVAHSWLNEEPITVGEMAHRLGYRSEAAFSRAFKRIFGDSPGSIRRGLLISEKSEAHVGQPPPRVLVERAFESQSQAK